MKRARWFLALVLLVAFTTTLGYAEDKMESKEKKDMKSAKGSDISTMLEAKERQVQEAFKNKDEKTFMSLVDPAAWMADPSGIASVSAAPEMMKQTDIQSYTIKDYAVHMIAKDVYVTTFVWNGVGMMGGQPYPPGPWYCSTVWAKRGNDWKAVYHQETLAMEPPTAESH